MRACWYVRLVYLHWCSEGGLHAAPPSAAAGRTSSLAAAAPPAPAAAVAGRPAGAPPDAAAAGLGLSMGAGQGLATAAAAGASSQYLLGVTPELAGSCSSLFTTHLLEHVDGCLAAAVAALTGQPPPPPPAGGAAAYAPTPLTPAQDAAAFSPAPDLYPSSAAHGEGGSTPPSAAAAAAAAGGGGAAAAAAQPSALQLANEALAQRAAEVLEPHPAAVLHYFVRLAAHALDEGLGDPAVVLEWVHKHLGPLAAACGGGVAGRVAPMGEADLFKAGVVLPLLDACVKVRRFCCSQPGPGSPVLALLRFLLLHGEVKR